MACGNDKLVYIPCCNSREVRIASISCDGALILLGEDALSRSRMLGNHSSGLSRTRLP